MARKTVSKEFGPLKVLCTQLPPTKALDILPEVARAFLPIIPYVKGINLSPGATFTMEDIAKLGPGLLAVADGLVGRQLSALAPKLLACTQVIVTPDGASEPTMFDLSNPSLIDAAFSDNAGQLLPVLRFAMEVTFKDFFPSIGQPAAAPTPKPNP